MHFEKVGNVAQTARRRYYGLPVISSAGPDPAGWPEAGDWLRRARRSGSLRWSELGPREVPPPEPVEELAAWLVDAVDRWWVAARRPDPYTLVVDSADDGTVARRVLELGPACLSCLRYVLVRTGRVPPVMAARLALEEPVFLFPAVSRGDDEQEEAEAAAGVGPLVTCLPAPPAVPGEGALVAIRTVGRLPSDRVELRPGGWSEIRLAEISGRLAEVASPLGPDAGFRTPPVAAPGRYAVLSGALEWLRGALSTEMRGRVTVVDDWTERTERVDAGSVPPLALDQMSRVRPPEAPQPGPVAAGLSAVTWRLNAIG